MRGTIVDKNNQVLAETVGTSGNFTRSIPYSLLSAVIGYNNPTYGQAGLEAGLDPILRGIQGNELQTVLEARYLYGQFPAGLNLRTSLDLNLQKIADEKMIGLTGGVILMNSVSGEILVMSTSPTFNSNEIDTKWQEYLNSKDSPLLNRVTQGQYPPGSATGGLILSRLLASGVDINSKINTSLLNDPKFSLDCAIPVSDDPTWGELVRSGCVEALSTLSSNLAASTMIGLYKEFGLFNKPDLPLEVADTKPLTTISNYQDLFSGSTNFLVSPLQMAIAYASLSNKDQIIAPKLAISYFSPTGEWILLQGYQPAIQLNDVQNAKVTDLLTSNYFPGWRVVSTSVTTTGNINWFIAGTLPDWNGTPLTLVVAIENSSAARAKEIGESIFNTAITPAIK
jgi:penicillin-binding protein A